MGLVQYVSALFYPMINDGMVFCVIVCIIVLSSIPEDVELLLGGAILQPVIPHIPRL